MVNIPTLLNDPEALNVEDLYAKNGKLKFPFNTVNSEIQQENYRKTLLKEKVMIEKAKKPAKGGNKKEAPVKPLDFES